MDGTHDTIRIGDTMTVDFNALGMTADLFKVFSNETRLGIIALLSKRAHNVGEMAELLSIDQGSLSQQLRTMRYMGVVESERKGHHVIYTLKDENIREIFQCGHKYTLSSG